MATHADRIQDVEEELTALGEEIRAVRDRLYSMEEEFRRFKLAVTQAVRLEYRE